MKNISAWERDEMISISKKSFRFLFQFEFRLNIPSVGCQTPGSDRFITRSRREQQVSDRRSRHHRPVMARKWNRRPRSVMRPPTTRAAEKEGLYCLLRERKKRTKKRLMFFSSSSPTTAIKKTHFCEPPKLFRISFYSFLFLLPLVFLPLTLSAIIIMFYGPCL